MKADIGWYRMTWVYTSLFVYNTTGIVCFIHCNRLVEIIPMPALDRCLRLVCTTRQGACSEDLGVWGEAFPALGRLAAPRSHKRGRIGKTTSFESKRCSCWGQNLILGGVLIYILAPFRADNPNCIHLLRFLGKASNCQVEQYQVPVEDDESTRASSSFVSFDQGCPQHC